MAKYYIYELILKCENETPTQMFMALQSYKSTYEKVFINDTDILHPLVSHRRLPSNLHAIWEFVNFY